MSSARGPDEQRKALLQHFRKQIKSRINPVGKCEMRLDRKCGRKVRHREDGQFCANWHRLQMEDLENRLNEDLETPN